MDIKKIFKKLSKKKPENGGGEIINFYNTDYDRHALISYITSPFREKNNFMHQNYVTSHIISESFSELGYNVDVVDYNDSSLNISYEKYSVIFGFGSNFEKSFYSSKRNISRVHFITGVHEALQNAMSLESVRDFYAISGIWLPNEAKVLRENWYFAF